jgi:hypothetical protein
VLGLSGSILATAFEVSAETLEPSQINFREIRSLGLAQSTTEKLARLFLDWSARSGEETPNECG